MPQVINTNIPSINAQRNLNSSQNDLAVSLQRLSSGLRINSAKDDAAGLAISDRMTAQIRGFTQASRNANDGISLAQTAEGALAESSSILQRIRELSIQSANATNTASDRLSLQSEVNQLISELDRISNSANFNGLKILDGSFTAQRFHVGAEADQFVEISINSATTDRLGIESYTTDNATLGISNATRSFDVDMATVNMNLAGTGTDYADAIATNLNAYDQVLTVTDDLGDTSTVTIAAGNRDMNAVATELNAINGIAATAINNAAFGDPSLFTNLENGDQVKFDLFSGVDSTTSISIDITYNSSTFIDDFDTAVNQAVTDLNSLKGNSDLSYDALTNTINSASGTNVGIANYESIDNISYTINAFTNSASAETNTLTFGTAMNSTVSFLNNASDQAATAQNLLDALEADFNFGSTFTAELDSVGTGVVITAIDGSATNLASITGDDAGGASNGGFTATALHAGTATGPYTIAEGGTTATAFTSADAASVMTFAGLTVTEDAADSAVKSGELSITLTNDSYSIQSSIGVGTNSLLNAAASTDATSTIGISGSDDISQGNNVAAQVISIFGTETETVTIDENESANAIVDKVNAVATITGVNATAKTIATLSNISSDGVIAFILNDIEISGLVSDNDYTALADAINDQTSKTGVIATLGIDNDEITLTELTGENIEILDFNNSADASTTVEVTGNQGNTVTLNALSTDSTVIGGEIEFTSTNMSFSLSSDIAGVDGSLFSTGANTFNSSQLFAVESIDISTIEGANEAIKITDGALGQIDSNRADLGAIQNRVQSTITNLSVTIENLNASRSRILDADFAAETAELTRNQILQQAGTAILAQANQLPQGVLTLLQG